MISFNHCRACTAREMHKTKIVYFSLPFKAFQFSHDSLPILSASSLLVLSALPSPGSTVDPSKPARSIRNAKLLLPLSNRIQVVVHC